jgi:receptor protein-tyrosine kinase
MQDATNQATDFGDYLRPLRVRWWLIAIIALVAAIGTYRYYAGKPVIYTATTRLYMQPNQVALPGNTSNGFDPSFIANQAILLRTPAVAAIAAKKIGWRGDPSVLLGYVSAVPEQGTDFMTISGVGTNAVDAARIANAFAQAYIANQTANTAQVIAQAIKGQQRNLAQIPQDAAHQLQREQLASGIAQLQLEQSTPTAPASQVQPAGLGVPSASDPTSHAIYGLILGLVIGIALSYALDALDRRIKRVPDVESAYDAPVLAKVPWAPPHVVNADPREGLPAALAEPFRALRTSLQLRPHASHSSNGNGVGAGHLQTILVASAVPDEGKSTVARNLALAYLEGGHRVVLVDCDLRRPDLTRSLRVDAVPGLPEVLTGVANVSEALQAVEIENDELPLIERVHEPVDEDALVLLGGGGHHEGLKTRRFIVPDPSPSAPQLSVLPSRTPPWNPTAIFGGDGIKDVLRKLRAQFDVVILDSSPLTVVSDAAPLVPLVDGVLLVGRVKKTTVPAVKDLKTMLTRLPHANVLGVVANDVRERSGTYVYSHAHEASA